MASRFNEILDVRLKYFLKNYDFDSCLKIFNKDTTRSGLRNTEIRVD